MSVSTVPFLAANDDELSRSDEIRGGGAGGGGSPLTVRVDAEIAIAEPAAFDAVTTARSTRPTSAWLSR